jgi:ribonuclease BN (tRNA processing enzyme)
MGVRVTFLGSGDAFNARGRCHASYLVSASSTAILLDCGPSILLAMNRDGQNPDVIEAVVLSHLHGDHFAGLPFLFLRYVYDAPRQRPLSIVGPPGTEGRVLDLYRIMYRDLTSRAMPFPLQFIEVRPDEPCRVGAVDLLPFAVPHQQSDISLGYRVAVDGKTVLYSGDSGWTEALVTQSRNTDLFICECCFYETRLDFHLDYPRIAENRHRFGCRRLVLTHVGREVLARRDDVRDEIAYDGLTVEV